MILRLEEVVVDIVRRVCLGRREERVDLRVVEKARVTARIMMSAAKVLVVRKEVEVVVVAVVCGCCSLR